MFYLSQMSLFRFSISIGFSNGVQRRQNDVVECLLADVSSGEQGDGWNQNLPHRQHFTSTDADRRREGKKTNQRVSNSVDQISIGSAETLHRFDQHDVIDRRNDQIRRPAKTRLGSTIVSFSSIFSRSNRHFPNGSTNLLRSVSFASAEGEKRRSG